MPRQFPRALRLPSRALLARWGRLVSKCVTWRLVVFPLLACFVNVQRLLDLDIGKRLIIVARRDQLGNYSPALGLLIYQKHLLLVVTQLTHVQD